MCQCQDCRQVPAAKSLPGEESPSPTAAAALQTVHWCQERQQHQEDGESGTNTEKTACSAA